MEEGLFTYSIPTRIIYGVHSRLKLGEEVRRLGIKRVLLVTDKGLMKRGIADEMEKLCQREGVGYQIFSDLNYEPTVGTVTEGVRMALEEECDGVIGLGGGSPLDTGKAIAMLVTNGGDFNQLLGRDTLFHLPLPFIAIPTTSGTGSEATRWSLILDEEAGMKRAIGCWEGMPDTALCDPLLTLTKPPDLTASTGMDALTHAIESLVNVNCQPISEAMALQSITLISRNLLKAVKAGDDVGARDGMMMGSLLAALAFNVTGITSVHAISHVVGARCQVPHGVANALLLPYVMEYSYSFAPHRFALISKVMGESLPGTGELEEAWKGVELVKDLLQSIGLTQGLSDYGLTLDGISPLAKEAAESPCNLLNPRPIDEDGIASILEEAL